MKLACPHCRAISEVSDELAGQQVVCPECRQPIGVPCRSSSARELRVFYDWLLAKTPYVFVTKALIAANVIVYVVMVARGVDWFMPKPDTMVEWGANVASRTRGGEWWRLITSTFLHFGIIHLAFNMWALSSAGPMVERLLGNFQFAIMYLFAGLTGSLASAFFNPPTIVSAGASGAVFGVFGALLAIVMTNRLAIPMAALARLKSSTTTFVAYNLLFGFTQRGIDNAAHIGGLVGGFLIGLVLTYHMRRPTVDADGTVTVDTQTKPLFGRVFSLAIFAGMVTAAMLFIMSAGGLHVQNPDIQLVKAGHFGNHPNITVGDAVNRVLANAKWEVLDGAQGQVSVRGTILHGGKPVDAVMHFALDAERKGFSVKGLDIDGQPQNPQTTNALIARMLAGS